ncbi:pilus assembly protein PilM [Candidatus Peregrinibacteria bacterium]|nr:pilus assembly protein PilM [Candidatus Peregrinibacteria bacterium]
MAFLGKKIIGIDFNDLTVQLVEISQSNNEFVLEAYSRLHLNPGVIVDGAILKADELRKVVAAALQGANPRAIISKEVALIFPSNKVFTHIFTFPGSLKDDEIRKALAFEAEKIIPFSIDDVYWDFTILEEKVGKKEDKTVLFSAVIKETADAYTELLKSLDLEPVIFGANIEALKYGLIKQLDHNQSHLIISIESGSTNYLIIKNGQIKYFYSSNISGRKLIKKLSTEFQIPENEILLQKEKNKLDVKLLPEIEEFINKTYRTATKILAEQSKKPHIGIINSILLTGEYINLPNFYSLAEKNFPKRIIEIGNPRKYLKIDDKNFKTLEDEKNYIPYSTYFTTSAGIALRALMEKSNRGINLIPDAVRESTINKKYSIGIAIATVLMCAISLFFATLIVFQHQNFSFERKKLEIEKSSIDKILYGTRYQEIRDATNSFNKEVSELGEIDNTLFPISTLLEKIMANIPKSITLSELQYNNADLSLEISGIADTREDLLSITKNFKELPFVDEVLTPISNYDQKSQISFSIGLRLIFKELKQINEKN